MQNHLPAPITIDASEVQDGDFIPGLDNAFVIDIDPNPDLRDGYNVNAADGTIMVTYNDAEGDEGYLLLTPGTRVTVQREA